MNTSLDYAAMLRTALDEARSGLAEGGIPIGAALYDGKGALLGRGHNRRVQENDPSVHAETDAFRKAGRQRSYRDKIMVTTLAPCWYCSGLVVQFGIGKVVIGESKTFRGGLDWLRERGVEIVEMNSPECEQMLSQYIATHPEIWNEDIGVDDCYCRTRLRGPCSAAIKREIAIMQGLRQYCSLYRKYAVRAETRRAIVR